MYSYSKTNIISFFTDVYIVDKFFKIQSVNRLKRGILYPGSFPVIRGVSTYVEYLLSSLENANATGSLDSLLSSLGEKFSLDDKWNVWEISFSEYLEVALLKQDVKIMF